MNKNYLNEKNTNSINKNTSYSNKFDINFSKLLNLNNKSIYKFELSKIEKEINTIIPNKDNNNKYTKINYIKDFKKNNFKLNLKNKNNLENRCNFISKNCILDKYKLDISNKCSNIESFKKLLKINYDINCSNNPFNYIDIPLINKNNNEFNNNNNYFFNSIAFNYVFRDLKKKSEKNSIAFKKQKCFNKTFTNTKFNSNLYANNNNNINNNNNNNKKCFNSKVIDNITKNSKSCINNIYSKIKLKKINNNSTKSITFNIPSIDDKLRKLQLKKEILKYKKLNVINKCSDNVNKNVLLKAKNSVAINANKENLILFKEENIRNSILSISNYCKKNNNCNLNSVIKSQSVYPNINTPIELNNVNFLDNKNRNYNLNKVYKRLENNKNKTLQNKHYGKNKDNYKLILKSMILEDSTIKNLNNVLNYTYNTSNNKINKNNDINNNIKIKNINF